MLLAGALYKLKPEDKQHFTHIPFSILPYRLDKTFHHTLKEVQHLWTSLFCKISEDREFLLGCLSQTIVHDEFLERLYKIYKHTENPQKLSVQVLRSDYMVDQESNFPLMVEYNLIASSFGCLSDRIQDVSKRLLSALLPEVYKYSQFPDTNNTASICDAFTKAIKLTGIEGKFVMVVKKDESNIYDQKIIELGMI